MIGIFDSGIGGLSVLAKLREKAPNADIVYFGDIAHAPYGVRPSEELQTLTSSAVELLLTEGARDIVSACNSVSAFMVLSESGLLASVPLSIVEMTRPTVRALARDFKEKKIVFFATPATITSGIYERVCREEGIQATFIAIPELAGAIEHGMAPERISSIVANAVSDIPEGTDVISLSCTHYSFVQHIFKEHLAKRMVDTHIFDPADSVAEEILAGCNINGMGTTRFILSKDSSIFREMLSRIPLKDPSVEVRSLNL